MESEEELKARQEKEQQEKQQAQETQENTPSSGEELSAKRMEDEINAEQEKEEAEKAETISEETGAEQAREDAREDISEEDIPEESIVEEENKEPEDIKVKEISFEKAELIEEHQKAQKTIEDWEKKGESEETGDDEDSEEPKDELEQDVNDMIEDSFKEQQQGYIKNNGPKEYVEPKKSYAIPIALAVIILCAAIFGFVYFFYPENATTAATVDVGKDADLAPAVPKMPEKVIVTDTIESNISKTANKNRTVKTNAANAVLTANATKAAAVQNAIKKPAEKLKQESASKPTEQTLNDLLLSGLN